MTPPFDTPDARIPAAARPGVARALRAAAWFSPLLLPLAGLQFILAAAPWLDSREATAQGALACLVEDHRARAAFEAVLGIGAGPAGMAALALLFTVGWVLVLHVLGVFSWRRLAAAVTGRGARGATALVPLAVLAAGLGACAGVQALSKQAGRIVDAMVGIRATSADYYALLLANEVLSAVVLATTLGATLVAVEPGLRLRDRLAPFACAMAFAGLGALGIVAFEQRVVARYDVGRVLAQALGRLPEEAPAEPWVIVLARDRTWSRPLPGGAFGLRYDPEIASAAEGLLERKRGLTLVAREAEPYLVGERLAALDPGTARARALRCVERRAAPATAHALFLSLGTALPDAPTRALIDGLLASKRLDLGPAALQLLARALAHGGDVERAQDLLARFRGSGGEQLLRTWGNSHALVVSPFADGVVRGRLLVDGRPWTGRVALMATEHLFVLPPSGVPCPITWLLRAGQATTCGQDGSFAFSDVTSEEQALVLLLEPGPRPAPGLRAPLPRIQLAPDARTLDLGEIDLALARGE